jgi:hypothetical protein
MTGCNWLRRREAETRTLQAFKQAMTDLGLADHPNGQCPYPGCRCEELADQVEARAIEIIEGTP